MYFKYFSIPKLVYWACLLPCLVIVLSCLIFYLVYRKKKGTYYYAFIMNYFYEVASMLISSLLLSLLIGYSYATIHIIKIMNLVDQYYIMILILIFIPLLPLSMFIWINFKLHHNMKYKEELDKNLKLLKEE